MLRLQRCTSTYLGRYLPTCRTPKCRGLSTTIEKIVTDTIKSTGPVSYAQYMQMCLSHPIEGYYMKKTNPVFGARGDFVTSPDISQVFGELVAIWLISQWMAAGSPQKVRIMELGPGRGTLMDDVLRVFSRIPAAAQALQRVVLVETSLTLREVQRQKLEPVASTLAVNLEWSDMLSEATSESPDEYTMLVAHEFFDALPIHLIERTAKGWQEVLVGLGSDAAYFPGPSQESIPETLASPLVIPSDELAITPASDPSPESTVPRLRPVLSPAPTPASMILGSSSPRFKEIPVGARLEVSPAVFKIGRSVGEALSGGGCGLIVDYGSDKAVGDSFRGFKDHKIVDIFHRPGECDLTANVDFAYLKEAIETLATPLGPISQAHFLDSMGLQLRVENLKKAARDPARAEDIMASAKRLVDKLGMGSEYKVMGIVKIPGEATEAGEVWPFIDLENQKTT